jgi:AAA lid domain
MQRPRSEGEIEEEKEREERVRTHKRAVSDSSQDSLDVSDSEEHGNNAHAHRRQRAPSHHSTPRGGGQSRGQLSARQLSAIYSHQGNNNTPQQQPQGSDRNTTHMRLGSMKAASASTSAASHVGQSRSGDDIVEWCASGAMGARVAAHRTELGGAAVLQPPVLVVAKKQKHGKHNKQKRAAAEGRGSGAWVGAAGGLAAPLAAITCALVARIHAVVDVSCTDVTQGHGLGTPTGLREGERELTAVADQKLRVAVAIARAVSAMFGWGESCALRSARGRTLSATPSSSVQLGRQTNAEQVMVLELTPTTTPRGLLHLLQATSTPHAVSDEELSTARLSLHLPVVLVVLGAEELDPLTAVTLAQILAEARTPAPRSIAASSTEEKLAPAGDGGRVSSVECGEICSALVLQYCDTHVTAPSTVERPVAAECGFRIALSVSSTTQTRRTRSRLRPSTTSVTAVAPPILVATELLRLRESAKTGVYVHQDILMFARDLVASARERSDATAVNAPPTGVPVFASRDLIELAKVVAAISGRRYLAPHDVSALLLPILSHRYYPRLGQDESDAAAVSVLEQVLADVEAPL